MYHICVDLGCLRWNWTIVHTVDTHGLIHFMFSAKAFTQRNILSLRINWGPTLGFKPTTI